MSRLMLEIMILTGYHWCRNYGGSFPHFFYYKVNSKFEKIIRIDVFSLGCYNTCHLRFHHIMAKGELGILSEMYMSIDSILYKWFSLSKRMVEERVGNILMLVVRLTLRREMNQNILNSEVDFWQVLTLR